MVLTSMVGIGLIVIVDKNRGSRSERDRAGGRATSLRLLESRKKRSGPASSGETTIPGWTTD
jgi:hypothetical protein